MSPVEPNQDKEIIRPPSSRSTHARQLTLFHFAGDNFEDVQDAIRKSEVSSVNTLSAIRRRALYLSRFEPATDFVRLADLLHHFAHSPSRVDSKEVDERLERLEASMEHAVRPALAKLVRYHEERDPLPAAASAEYEWQREAKKVLKVADDLIVDFDDLQIRLSQHVAITEKIGALLKVARSMNDKNLRSAVLTVQDALYSVFSENMTLEQAESIRQVLGML